MSKKWAIIFADENGDALGDSLAHTPADAQDETLLETLCYGEAETLVHA